MKTHTLSIPIITLVAACASAPAFGQQNDDGKQRQSRGIVTSAQWVVPDIRTRDSLLGPRAGDVVVVRRPGVKQQLWLKTDTGWREIADRRN
jgi:hypothetical protein